MREARIKTGSRQPFVGGRRRFSSPIRQRLVIGQGDVPLLSRQTETSPRQHSPFPFLFCLR
jgi:hypothetical protein